MPRAKTAEIAFPRTLYKPAERSDSTSTNWGSDQRGGAFHSLLVENEKEHKAAMQMGWYDDFAKACAASPDELNEDMAMTPDGEVIPEEETNGDNETGSDDLKNDAENEPDEDVAMTPDGEVVVDTTPEDKDEGF